MSFWSKLAAGVAGGLGGQGIAGRAADAMTGRSSHPAMRAAEGLNRSGDSTPPDKSRASGHDRFRERMTQRRTARRDARRGMRGMSR
jgi:hypothetical protein